MKPVNSFQGSEDVNLIQYYNGLDATTTLYS